MAAPTVVWDSGWGISFRGYTAHRLGYHTPPTREPCGGYFPLTNQLKGRGGVHFILASVAYFKSAIDTRRGTTCGRRSLGID